MTEWNVELNEEFEAELETYPEEVPSF